MPTAEKQKYKVVGTRPIRHDGRDKVTGRAKYGADIKLTGMLYAAMLRSAHAHAKIKRIDTAKAEALPGVRAVATSRDLSEQGDRIVELSEGAANMRHLSANILAQEKVLYKGHAVAAVAADSIHIAEEAVGLIEVDYEPLPPVLDVREAMKDDAPVLNDDVYTESPGSDARAQGAKPSNIARQFRFVSKKATSTRVLPRQTCASSGNSTRRWFTRAISSRTTRRRCGMRTGRSPSG